MIIVPTPNGGTWGFVLGLAIGVVLFILLLPVLERYMFPILDRYLEWADRKLKRKG